LDVDVTDIAAVETLCHVQRFGVRMSRQIK
jgi:hypothetical protein